MRRRSVDQMLSPSPLISSASTVKSMVACGCTWVKVLMTTAVAPGAAPAPAALGAEQVADTAGDRLVVGAQSGLVQCKDGVCRLLGSPAPGVRSGCSRGLLVQEFRLEGGDGAVDTICIAETVVADGDEAVDPVSDCLRAFVVVVVALEPGERLCRAWR